MERRNSRRTSCRVPCEVAGAQARAEGVVLDLSDGGLSIQTESWFEQGDLLKVRLRPPRHREIGVEAMVWHTRRVRLRSSGDVRSVLGLMLAEAPEDYYGLIPEPGSEEDRVDTKEPDAAADGSEESAAPAAAPARQAAPESPPDGPDEPDESIPQLFSYRVRIKHRSGPRTRILSFSAQSEQEARALIEEELGEQWRILSLARA